MAITYILSNYRLVRPAWFFGSPARVSMDLNVPQNVSYVRLGVRVNKIMIFPIFGSGYEVETIESSNIWAVVNNQGVALIPTAGLWTYISVGNESVQDITSKIVKGSTNNIKICFNTLVGGGVDVWVDAWLEHDGDEIVPVVPPKQEVPNTIFNPEYLANLIMSIIILMVIISLLNIIRR